MTSSKDELEALIRRYVSLAIQLKELLQERDRIESLLKVDLEGLPPDDHGTRTYQFPETIGGFGGIEYRLSPSMDVDEMRAWRVANELDLEQRCFPLRPVLDEEELLTMHYEGLIDEEQLAQIFPNTYGVELILLHEL